MGKNRQCPSDLINCAKRFFIPHSILNLHFALRIANCGFRILIKPDQILDDSSCISFLSLQTSNALNPGFFQSAIRIPESEIKLFSKDILHDQITDLRGGIPHLPGSQAFYILFGYLHDRFFDLPGSLSLP